MPKTLRTARQAPKASEGRDHCNIIHAGDMSSASLWSVALAGEIAAAANAGYAVGLLHVPAAESGAAVAPEIARTVRDGTARILDPEAKIAARLLILHHPDNLRRALDRLNRIAASRIVVIADDRCDRTGVTSSKTMSIVAPAHIIGPGSGTLPAAAWPLAVQAEAPRQAATSSPKKKIGLVAGSGDAATIASLAEKTRADDCEVLFWTLRGDPAADLSLPEHWITFDGRETSFGWFLSRIDAVTFMEHACHGVLIASAAASGIPVIVSARHHAAHGKIACPAHDHDLISTARSLLDDARATATQTRRALAFAKKMFAPERYLARIARLIGPAPRRRAAARYRPVTPPVPRVLFLPKGGVGLGHVARSLAIARRAGKAYEPVFATMADSAGLIESFGFRAEYVPPASSSASSPDDWDPWFEAEIGDLIETYDAEAVVFDGSDPPPGLLRAAARHGRCRLAWVRRGMWEPGYDPGLGCRQASMRSSSPATSRRALTGAPRRPAARRPFTSTPSRFSTRTISCRAPRHGWRWVSTPKGRPCCCSSAPARTGTSCRPRSGHRDAQDLEGVQIALAEWTNSASPLNLWRGITLLKGAPLSRYFNAFDFSITAAGYNTFHEAIRFGLPSIFMPNTAPGMDDQAARARFAQDRGAAIELQQEDIGELPAILDLMMKDGARDVMRRNCAALSANNNGAAAASACIAALLH